jgi:DNA-binding CsgD family transcriptional regulator
MGRKLQQLRSRDVLAVQQLVLECTDLWYDPNAWRMHLLEGMRRLTGVGVVGCEHVEFPRETPNGTAIAVASVGWPDDETERRFVDALGRDVGRRQLPAELMQHTKRALGEQGRVAFLVPEVMEERVWQRSFFFEACLDPSGIRHVGVSFRIMPWLRQVMVLNLNQTESKRKLHAWQKGLLEFAHGSIAPLVGRRLAVEGQRSVEGLSPRRRQVLDLLLQGRSEKEVAAALDLSPATVHEYVGGIYRHLSVNSRAELMAFFIRRDPSASA